MLSFSGRLRVFVAVEPWDMRKGFNGLHAMASERLGEDPRQYQSHARRDLLRPSRCAISG